MYSIDSNIILRFVLRDVPEQARAAEDLFKRMKPGSIQVADAVFFECVWVLTGPLYSFERKDIAEILLRLIKVPCFNCNRQLLEKAIPRYLQHSSASFLDVCLATYAELNGATPLLTYDKVLAKSLPRLASTDIVGA